MAKIKPVRALFYNQERFPDLSKLVCPPYDVISAEEQDYYHNLSPYNFIHVLLRKDYPGEDKYQKAGVIFRNWIKEKVLLQNTRPAVYFYSQEYKIKGEKKRRLGFICLLELDQRGSNVFGHENTHSFAKKDRLELLRSTNANLSPIFVVFQDKKRLIKRIFDHHISSKSKPFIELIDKEGIRHLVWSIEEEKILDFLQKNMEKEEVFIADGHHRYEVACLYRDQIRQRLGDKFLEDSSFNYILCYFTNSDRRGLTILPIHRLVKIEKEELPLDLFLENLKTYFEIEKIKEKERFLFLIEKGSLNEHFIGMYKDKRYWLLRIKNLKILEKEMAHLPKEYRLIDAVILDYFVFNNILRKKLQKDIVVSYSSSEEELLKAVDNSNDSVAFFLRAVKMEEIMAVALKGNKMPAKTTYFYPKVLSGLVIHKHDEI